MATRSLVQLRGFFESLAGGSKSLALADLQNNFPPGYEQQVVLASGPNTIVVPTVATIVNSILGVIVIFQPTSTVAKTIKGVTGDTGIRVNAAGWNVLSFDPANLPTQLVITAGAADTGKSTQIIFF